MIDKQKLIKGCKRRKAKYQKMLFVEYAPMLRGVCLRYAGNKDEAEDILQEAFFKILTKINTYKGEGVFEGWMRRVTVNCALNHLKEKKRLNLFNTDEYEVADEIEEIELNEENNVDLSDFKSVIYNSGLSKEDIVSIINELPDGFRIIFNLHTFEKKKHKEIAEMLNISENTSKSQLSRAKKQLQGRLYEVSVKKIIKKDEIVD